MTRIYLQTTAERPVDPELLEALQAGLPDDYWAFLNLGTTRPFDCLLIREVPEAEAASSHSLVRCVTLQRADRQLRGTATDPWSGQAPDGTWEPLPALPHGDSNPFQQAVQAANAARAWLHNHQRLFLAAAAGVPADDFRVWPDLLLLSPDGAPHRLPISPPSGFGSWFFSVGEWLAHVRAWQPRQGRAFTGPELAALAAELHLRRLSEPAWPVATSALPCAELAAPRAEPAPPAVEDAAAGVAGAAPAAGEDLGGVPEAVLGFARWLGWLEARLARLEGLEGPGVATGGAPAGPAARANGHLPAEEGAWPAPMISRPWGMAEREALACALADLRRQGGNRTLPSVLERMNQQLGYRLKDRSYNGFGSAGAMFEQARREGLVVAVPAYGANPGMYDPGEPIPGPALG